MTAARFRLESGRLVRLADGTDWWIQHEAAFDAVDALRTLPADDYHPTTLAVDTRASAAQALTLVAADGSDVSKVVAEGAKVLVPYGTPVEVEEPGPLVSGGGSPGARLSTGRKIAIVLFGLAGVLGVTAALKWRRERQTRKPRTRYNEEKFYRWLNRSEKRRR